jgi:hypothetical protein
MAKKSTSTTTNDTSAPPAIRELVEKFAEHRETYQRGDYIDTQMRQDFSIDLCTANDALLSFPRRRGI